MIHKLKYGHWPQWFGVKSKVWLKPRYYCSLCSRCKGGGETYQELYRKGVL